MKLAIESYVEEKADVTSYDMNDCTVKLQGINAAMESVSALEKIKKTLLKSKGKPRSKTTIKIGKLALESIKKDTGIFTDGSIVSMECFTEDTISVEGINDIVKSIIDAIVRTFKAVWEQIKRFVDAIIKGLGFQKQQRKLDDVKTSIKEIKELKTKKAIKIPNESKKPLTATEFGIIAPFLHLNTKINEAVLRSEMEKLKKTIKDCSNLLMTLEVCNVNMAESVYNMQKDGINDHTLKEGHFATGAFYQQMGTQFEPDTTIDQYADIIQSKLGIPIDMIDKRRTRTVPGLTRGNKVFVFCKILKGNEDTDFQLLNVTLVNGAKNHAAVVSSDLNHLLDYATTCQSVLEDYNDVLSKYAEKSQNIQAIQGKIVRSLTELVSKSTGDEMLDSSVRYIKAVAVSLTKATVDLQKIFNFIDKATEDHTKILSYLRKEYTAEPHEGSHLQS